MFFQKLVYKQVEYNFLLLIQISTIDFANVDERSITNIIRGITLWREVINQIIITSQLRWEVIKLIKSKVRIYNKRWVLLILLVLLLS